MTLQSHRVYFTLKRRGNGHLHVVSTWNTSGVFVGVLWNYLLGFYQLNTSNFLDEKHVKFVFISVKTKMMQQICFLLIENKILIFESLFIASTSWSLSKNFTFSCMSKKEVQQYQTQQTYIVISLLILSNFLPMMV